MTNIALGQVNWSAPDPALGFAVARQRFRPTVPTRPAIGALGTGYSTRGHHKGLHDGDVLTGNGACIGTRPKVLLRHSWRQCS
jgi:hypothetical protein